MTIHSDPVKRDLERLADLVAGVSHLGLPMTHDELPRLMDLLWPEPRVDMGEPTVYDAVAHQFDKSDIYDEGARQPPERRPLGGRWLGALILL